MDGEGYWISPNGEFYLMKANHINFVGENPELFNLTRDEFLKLFKKYKEPINFEGQARKEMFEAIFKLGWIRIREKSNSIWTVELWKFENQTENNIKIWWNRVRKKGGKFNSEILKINFLSDNTQKKISFEEF